MSNYIFTPDAVIISGKSFPACYALTPEKTLQLYLTVEDDGRPETVLVEIDPADEDLYLEADHAMKEAAKPAAPAADPIEERPETICTEPETENEKEDEPMKNAVIIVPVNEENNALEPKNAVEAVTETAAEAPAEIITEATAPAEERPAAIPAEAPAPVDPKAAHGPVPEKSFINETIKGAGWSIVFDRGNDRTRVIVSDAARETARPIIEAAGFYYSRNMDSWNKKLTHRAHRAALALADQLNAAFAA